MDKENRWISVAMGISILSLMLGHFGIAGVNNVVYAYHVTVIFLLCGYVLKKDIFNKEYVNNTFCKLMVPYFVTSACVMLMDIVNCFFLWDNTTNGNVTYIIAKDMLRTFWASGDITTFGNIEIGTRIGAIWILPALFFVQVIVQAILNYIDDKKIQYVVAFLLSLTGYITARFIWLPFSIQSALLATPFVLLGCDIKQKEILKKLKITSFVACLLVFVWGTFNNVSFIVFATAHMPDYIVSFVVGLCGSACIIYLARKMEWCKPVALIGKYSLNILCIHLFVLETMWTWVENALNSIGIYNAFTNFLTQLVLILLINFILVNGKRLIVKLSEKKNVSNAVTATTRDGAIDVAKGILIILMIIGHVAIDPAFRRIIYSFHMVAFIFFSGVCFKSRACDNLKTAIIKLMKAFLIPYGVFGVIYCIITHDGITIEIRNVLYGLSFARNWFTDITQMGPIYFVLLLFVVRFVYLFIEKYVKEDWEKHIVVLVLSVAGFLLGQHGYWLPWSADIALYSLIFYHMGYCFKKYGAMQYISGRYYWYFILSSIWCFMIFQGSMEIAVRHYNIYSIGVIGPVCATMLLYMLSQSITRVKNGILTKILDLVGKNTIYILIVHTLFGGYIYSWLYKYFAEGHLMHLIVVTIVQVMCGVLVSVVIGLIKKIVPKQKLSTNTEGK